MIRKIWMIIILTLLCLIIAILLWWKASENSKTYTLNEIIGHSPDDIATAESPTGEDASDIIRQYQDCLFMKYAGSLGNTAHRKIVLYDKEKNELAVITDIGNNDIIEVDTNGSKIFYKIAD